MGSRPRRQRRVLLYIASVLLALLLLAALALHYAMQPQRATRFLLARVGAALDLEITATGKAEYQLRGLPTLVLRDVVAQEPGTATPLLRADRIFLSLPWSTLRARGAVLGATRIELDAPVLDLPALQHWLARRPPSPTPVRMPSLSAGALVRDGVVIGDGWRLEDLQAEVPSFAPGVASRLALKGTYPEPPFSFAVSGPLRWNAGTWSLAPARVSARGRGEPDTDPIPALEARGDVALGEHLVLRLHGGIEAWPAAWPTLPEPLASSRSPMAFALRYRGAVDLDDTAFLQLQRDDTAFDGSFRLREVLAWAGADPNPLPPVEGTLRTPRLDVAGATLQGVSVQLEVVADEAD